MRCNRGNRASLFYEVKVILLIFVPSYLSNYDMEKCYRYCNNAMLCLLFSQVQVTKQDTVSKKKIPSLE